MIIGGVFTQSYTVVQIKYNGFEMFVHTEQDSDEKEDQSAVRVQKYH